MQVVLRKLQQLGIRRLLLEGGGRINGSFLAADNVDNVGAAQVGFTPSELAELNGAVSAVQVRGARLPDEVLVFSGWRHRRRSEGRRTFPFLTAKIAAP